MVGEARRYGATAPRSATATGGTSPPPSPPAATPWTRQRAVEAAAATTSVIKLLLGAASFGLPWAFARAGLGVSVAMVVAVGGLSAYTIRLLLETRRRLGDAPPLPPLPPPAADHDGCLPAWQAAPVPPPPLAGDGGADAAAPTPPDADYATMAAATLGPAAGAYVRLATCVSCIGACAGYVAFIAGVVVAVAPAPPPTPRAVMVWLLPALVALSQVQTWAHLAAASLAGNVAFAVAVVCVMAAARPRLAAASAAAAAAAAAGAATAAAPSGGRVPTVAPWATPGAWALAFGPTTFLFTVHYVAVPLASTVGVAGDFEGLVLPAAFGVCVAVNVVFAAACAVAYAGVGVADNIFRNYVEKGLLGDRADVSPAVAASASAAAAVPPPPPPPPTRRRVWAERCTRAGLAATTVAVAAAVPHFARLTALAGGVSDASLAFVLPPLMAAAVRRRGRVRTAAAGGAMGGGAGAPRAPPGRRPAPSTRGRRRSSPSQWSGGDLPSPP
ncbi:hypothetical protein BU14_0320s0017 [Porphyra umbilicalis]|uniref:Amino acid transporter transmembrane domain-containing protein n=1 Tax=Porphyra umbilicalis TaxID=2786 RepID=A0A1X6NZF6_PORUM|nr:hypothetical protein BU14_0320s0017 [Porphyra umbilicalis]|eukprot:OSX73906.1 hypothetical protein BU14_0320s0017 [Porphyra umbilicalis]